jgi:hypothetical protein
VPICSTWEKENSTKELIVMRRKNKKKERERYNKNMVSKEDIKQMYQNLGIEYVPSVQDIAEEEFYTRAVKDTIKRRIDHVYRLRSTVDSKGEYLIYDETILAQDKDNKPLDFSHSVGKYEVPISISNKKWIYDIPFSKEKLQEILDSDQATEVEKQERPIGFTLILGDGNENAIRTFSAFTADEFLNEDFSTLLHKVTAKTRL